MKRIALVLALSAVLAVLTSAQSRIVYVLGDVTVTSGGDEFFADIGTPVSTGDTVATGPDGHVIIELVSGSELKLRANSEVRIGEVAGDITADLNHGSVFARVQNLAGRQFRLRVDSVVAGVRGTEFFVSYGRTVEELPDVWLCVNDGAVDVSVAGSDESVVVEEGEGINILSGTRLTRPRFYDWTTDLNWSMDPESGDIVDDTDLDQAYGDLLDQDYD